MFDQYLALLSVTAKASIRLSHSAAAFVYRADDDKVPASVNLVYNTKTGRRFYQSTGIGRRQQTEFNCIHQ